MEKSHHAAKASNQNHTQHGGTKNKTSAIVQQYEHWYRNIQHRVLKGEEKALLKSKPVDEEALAAFRRHSLASTLPSVAEGRRRWRQSRVRIGRVWSQQHQHAHDEGTNNDDTEATGNCSNAHRDEVTFD